MSPLPLPRRVVIGADAHTELIAQLREVRPDLDVRGNAPTDITEADFSWGDTYIGFKRPPLPTMGNIRWVHCTGAGVDAWLYPTELPRSILLTRTSESFGTYIAEWALARALAFTQQIFDLNDCQQRHEWRPREVRYIRGSRALIVGTGEIGSRIGRLFSALGCSVRGVSRSGQGDPDIFTSTVSVDRLGESVADADWLIVTIPLTTETRGLIGRDVMSACHGAFMINAGRGAVVDEGAIADALDRGWLAGAALDVFATEPLPRESPLWGDRRVMVSPHMSGLTTIKGTIVGFLECLAEMERGQLPTRVVDRDRQY